MTYVGEYKYECEVDYQIIKIYINVYNMYVCMYVCMYV